MIDIAIFGASKKHTKFLDRAARFYFSILLPNAEALRIRIKMKKHLMKKHLASAQVRPNGWKLPFKRFFIEIDSTQSFLNQLTSLAHECVHVAQYYDGRLRLDEGHPHLSWWFEELIDTQSMSYWDLPWEVDASGREKGLFIRWLEAENLMGKHKWADRSKV